MPRNDPNYKVARDALMRNFERELNFDDNLLAGIYTVKENSLNVKCKCLYNRYTFSIVKAQTHALFFLGIPTLMSRIQSLGIFF